MKTLRLFGCFIFFLLNLPALFAQTAQAPRLTAKCVSGNCQTGLGELVILNKQGELTDRLAGEFRGGEFIKGSHYIYGKGLTAASVERDEGLFKGFVLSEGTVTLVDYGVKDSVFDTRIYTPQGNCAGGNCVTGDGKWGLLKPGFSEAEIIVKEGKFKDGLFLSGTALVEGVDTLVDGSYTLTDYKYHAAHNQAFADAVFVPKGYDDKIRGTWHPDANPSFFKIPFFLSDDYYQKGQAGSHLHFKTKGLPRWISDVYRPVSYARGVVADAAAREARVEALRQDMKLHPNDYKSTDTYAPSAQGTGKSNLPSSSFSKCSVCNGVGFTEYDCGQGGGRPCRKYCNACNGTGQVHN